jgi:hypothetical protein
MSSRALSSIRLVRVAPFAHRQATQAAANAGYEVQGGSRCVRPMTMVGRLVEADAVGAGCCAHAAGFLLGVELETADEIARVVVKAREVLYGGLLQRYWERLAIYSDNGAGCHTLLRRAAQHRRERRRGAPDVLQARVVVPLAFEAGDAVGQFGLTLLHAKHLVLEGPDVVPRLES